MSDTRIDTKNPEEIRTLVREKYGAIASSGANACGPSSGCGSSAPTAVAEQVGYTAEQVAALPAGANLGLGCGNPLAFAAVKLGETVLDLGSGAGIDAFLAAREVGPLGRVIGVDMTPAMIDKARANAARTGFDHVEFRLGEIEQLPVADTSVDVVISNCVVNLSPDKPRVFREAFRVLRPGGRLLVSDIVLLRDLPAAIRRSAEAYVGCVAGASRRDAYLADIGAAGFADVEVVHESPYTVGVEAADHDMHDALASVASVKVRARKPEHAPAA